jgi:hypothetical protein
MTNKRFFAFGCSATSCNWPTWADIVARQYDEYQNWALPGAGNPFIFYSVMEAIKRNTITKDDTVMIMWTNIGREDRYVKGQGWITPGSIYNQTVYSQDFVRDYADPTGYLIRDMAHLSAVKSLLDTIGCAYKFFTTVPFNVPDDNIFKVFSIDTKITKLYADDIRSVAPSVFEIVFNFDWYSRPGVKDLAALEQQYNGVKGDAWPIWEDFVQQDWRGVARGIRQEIDEKYFFSKQLLARTNTHLLPAEHLEYLDRVSDIVIDADTRRWVNEINTAILNGNDFKKLWQPQGKVTRF